MERVSIRPITASDEVALAALYAELSDDARCARFLGCTRTVDKDWVRRMCAANGTREAGFVAEHAGARGRMVGHVSLTQAAPGAREIAIAVVERFGHRGIGLRLFEAAIDWAVANGIESIVATAFTDNWSVLRLLRSSSYASTVRDIGCALSSVRISTTEPGELKRAA